MAIYLKKTNNFDTSKASQQSDVPTKILKQNSYSFARYFCGNINQCVSKSIFPPDLKLDDVTPICKNKSKNSKDNYRLVSVLTNISKIYERYLYDQIKAFFDSVLCKYQCAFRRGYNAQSCLITDNSTPSNADKNTEFVINSPLYLNGLTTNT